MSCGIKITERKPCNSPDSPRFVLTLEPSKLRDDHAACNYAVLSKLMGNSSIVINLNSSLINLPYHLRKSHVLEFIDEIRMLGLEYKLLNFRSHTETSFLSRLLSIKSETEELEALVYVPNEVWVKSGFEKIAPYYGARYFIAHENAGDPKLLDDMQKMTDNEKLDFFKMIVFDSVCLNSMGICTKFLTLHELKKLFET